MVNGQNAVLLALAGALLANPANASLILLGPNPISGAGLGAQETILTIQSQGQNQAESGCVSPSGPSSTGTCSEFPNNTVQSGANTTVRGIAETVRATDIRIVFNAAEPGNDDLITLNALELTAYSGGASISLSGLRNENGDQVASLDFNPFSGVGNAGYIFALSTNPSDNQAALLQAFLDANQNVTLGLGASLTNAAAGLETFSLRLASGTDPGDPGDPGEIPEPSTAVLIAVGALTLVLGRARRKRIKA